MNKRELVETKLKFYKHHYTLVGTKVIPKLPLNSPLLIRAWAKLFKKKERPKKLSAKNRMLLSREMVRRAKNLTTIDVEAGSGCVLDCQLFFETQLDGFYGTYHLVGGYTIYLKSNKDYSTNVLVQPKGQKKMFLLMKK